MRLLIILLTIFIFLVGFGVWNNKTLLDSTDKMTAHIEQIITDIEGQHWDQARQETRQLEKSWHENAKWWPVFLDHQEIDNLEFSMAKIKKYVDTRDAPLAQGQLSELKLMLKHIPDKEAVTLENIL